MARPKKPLILHKMHGTSRPDRDAKRENELQLPSELPAPAAWLLPEARRVWDLVTKGPYAPTLSTVDGPLLNTYCQLCGWYERTQTRKDGDPPVLMSATELRTMIDLGARFGFDPQSRTKIHVQAPDEAKAEDPWAKLG